MNNGFILERSCIQVPAVQVEVHQCRFKTDIQNVSVEYEQRGIVLPESLKTASVGRQSEFLAGRLCAAAAFQKFGISEFNIVPNEDRSPVWPQDFAGSISHKHDRAVAAVSDQFNYFGLDLETLMKTSTAEKIARKIIVDSEKDAIAQSPLSFSEGFTAVFSAKEALYKGIYPYIKRYLPFSVCKVTELSDSHLVLLLSEELRQELKCSEEFHVHCHWQNDRVITLLAKKE